MIETTVLMNKPGAELIKTEQCTGWIRIENNFELNDGEKSSSWISAQKEQQDIDNLCYFIQKKKNHLNSLDSWNNNVFLFIKRIIDSELCL